MRHVLRLVLTGILLAMAVVSPSIALASDISSATYSGIIVVTNNSTAATAATVMTLSSADMISQGWISSNFSNMAIRNSSGADVVFGPSVNSTYPWSLWVPSIGANSAINYIMYTGPSDMSSTKYWFPGTSGGAVADSASMEPGTNFDITFTGYFETTAAASKRLINKGSPLDVSVSATDSGNITASIVWNTYPAIASTSNGTALATTNTAVNLPSGYSAGDMLIIAVGTYNVVASPTLTAPAGWTQLYQTPYSPGGLFLTQSAWYRVATGAESATANWTLTVSSDFYYSFVRIPSGTYSGNPVSNANATTATSINADPPNLATGFGAVATTFFAVGTINAAVTGDPAGYTVLPNTSGSYLRLTAANITADPEDPGTFTNVNAQWEANTIGLQYSYGTSVSATGISSGEATISITQNSTSLGIVKDGVTLATGTRGYVDDTSTNFTFADGGSMIYIESINMTVGGVTKGYWNWEYATTFTDDSGNGNTMTPSFRTASSDADVSAELTTFGPINVAIGPAYTVSDPPDFISTSNITMSASFTTGNVSSSNLPGSDVIDDSAAAAGVPNIWLWGIFGGLLIAVLGLVLSWLERTYGGGNGTLLARFAVGAIVMGVMVTLNGRFDWWMLLMYCAIALAPVIASRQYDVGASPSELNLIGFLAMTWLGITTINKMMGSVIIDSAQTTMVNQWMFTQNFKLLDLFSMPILNFQFFTQGIPALVRWDYLSFGGNAQIIQYMLYSLTAVVGFIVFVTTAGLMTSYFTRAR